MSVSRGPPKGLDVDRMLPSQNFADFQDKIDRNLVKFDNYLHFDACDKQNTINTIIISLIIIKNHLQNQVGRTVSGAEKTNKHLMMAVLHVI